ncbi:MAG: hypothetical protein N3D84_00670 [Candidatus Woesearchaeota archaeon]|nr:hypothetical protein [Candidatus Woesearchaeota archaeon]
MLYSEGKAEKHLEFKKRFNFTVYWTVLLVLTIGNFLISVILIPFLLVFKPVHLALIVSILGIIFGLMFNLIIRDIEHIEKEHHLIAAIFIPSIALINIFVMVNIANNLAARLKLPAHENAFLISLLYVIVFIIPYVFSEIKDFLKKAESKKLKS